MPVTSSRQASSAGTRPAARARARSRHARAGNVRRNRAALRFSQSPALLFARSCLALAHGEAFAPILARPEARVLDICCGTGDLLSRSTARASAVPVVNARGSASESSAAISSKAMLVRAQAKRRSEGHVRQCLPQPTPASSLCDASFDLVTTAFGFPQSRQLREAVCAKSPAC